MSLAPGDYVLEFSAPGYEDDRQTVHLTAGASNAWTPIVRAAAKAAPSPAAPPPPVHDRAADLDAISKAVRNFAAALDKRDSRTVVPLLPSEVRKGFQELLESVSVDGFHAQIVNTQPPVVTGDNATVDFTMRLNYRDADAKQDVPLHFTGTAVRDGSGWRLASLRSNN